MRITSKCLQRWLASWIALVVLWLGDYVIYWLTHKPDLSEIIEFILPVLILLIISSAYAEANGEGQNMIRVCNGLKCLLLKFISKIMGPSPLLAQRMRISEKFLCYPGFKLGPDNREK